MSYIYGVLKHQAAGFEQLRKKFCDSSPGEAVTAAEYPHELKRNLACDKARVLGGQPFKQSSGIGLLIRIVACEESDEDVRVEGDQDS